MNETNRRNFVTGSMATVASAGLITGGTAVAANSTQSHQEKTMSHTENTYLSFNIQNTALVLVDHQVGTIGWAGELTTGEQEQLKMWTRVMARFAAGAGMPIVLTSSMEDQPQGPLLPEFQTLMPKEYAARIKRTGVINAWDDPAFVAAVKATGKKNILMGGLTTDVCLVPPALAAKKAGYNVVALMDISAACTKTAATNSREALNRSGVNCMTVTPMITSMLGNYTSPASRYFFEAFEKEGVYGAFAKGNLR